MQVETALVDLASARLRSLLWERQQAYGLDHGGFDWDRWQRKNAGKETEIGLLQGWLREAQKCA